MFVTFTVAAVVAYVVAAFLFLAGLSSERARLGDGALIAVALGLTSQCTALLWRAVDVGPSELFATPGGLALFAVMLVAGYLVLDRRYDIRPVGALVAPLAALSLLLGLPGEGLVSEDRLDILLAVHVTLALIGTAAFALAFLLALVYATQDYQLRTKRFGVLFRRLPPLDRLDQSGFRCVTVGFPVYTLAMLLGFVRAWQLDQGFAQATVVLAVVTWLLYGLVLQARITVGWRGSKAAVMTILGFLTAAAVVVFYAVR